MAAQLPLYLESVPLLRLLIDDGADVDQQCSASKIDRSSSSMQDGHQRTPLYWAAFYFHKEAVSLLLTAGADWTQVKRGSHLELVYSCLMEACWFPLEEAEPPLPLADRTYGYNGNEGQREVISSDEKGHAFMSPEDPQASPSPRYVWEQIDSLLGDIQRLRDQLKHVRLEVLVFVAVTSLVFLRRLAVWISMHDMPSLKLSAFLLLLRYVVAEMSTHGSQAEALRHGL